MLSYRHAFHAGNHADVLKHAIEVLLLQHLGQKDAPYWYIDTHAGAGLYALDEGYASQNAEFAAGIARLWQRDDLPPALRPYLEVVEGFNPDGRLTRYPGSPLVADRVMAQSGKLRLFELHPSDHRLLQDNFAGRHRRCLIQQTDGFEGIKAILPPPPRRALVLIDPPYEDKQDYLRVPVALAEGLKRFATGVYAVWYPLLQRAEMRALPDALKKLPVKRWLDVTLTVRRPSADGFGMHGSGMFIINPPWTLAETLTETLPWLTEALALDAGATHTLRYQGD
ncbi:MAG: 23S rRNA (adenine(2030)-N(6))-methyltransferase RlmJ [Paludibacterium sp.]|uniref:23S rRNA (adenine(2030)-N(6))-methyltransferase RlmJ n=1 Tax=Paludibacterium sp. TaxID=1917523 RepID=UPI0025CDC610|nr:23S rRNA (adenine(2030)-N(6))-methyltransferase RlmJ [Paludibacterium sp.]MBV8046952.1 23S rRNA (adenine(2030)-N(6))-methyltransferase RlmJ [Paludibacterium sp.]MBV8646545.1 23S rRNA (adenine(2030)-N(6))-methyltransferase RlmJ [Paludibacterium sp.]